VRSQWERTAQSAEDAAVDCCCAYERHMVCEETPPTAQTELREQDLEEVPMAMGSGFDVHRAQITLGTWIPWPAARIMALTHSTRSVVDAQTPFDKGVEILGTLPDQVRVNLIRQNQKPLVTNRLHHKVADLLGQHLTPTLDQPGHARL
jgi:hypothetical protein